MGDPNLILARRAARLLAVQAIYQRSIMPDSAEALIKQFITHRLIDGAGEVPALQPDRGHFALLVNGAVTRQHDIETIIRGHLNATWTLERLPGVLKSLLSVGLSELLHANDVPHQVIIDEYVELAKDFVSDKEAKFVNALLDRAGKTLRSIPA